MQVAVLLLAFRPSAARSAAYSRRPARASVRHGPCLWYLARSCVPRPAVPGSPKRPLPLPPACH